jgi:hypothetical protein
MGIGRAEMLILLGAIAIFGQYTLTINNSRYNNEFRIIACENQTVAASIAESIIAGATTKEFDETTVDATLYGGTELLTDPLDLGAESGEVYPDYDDVDDYKDFGMTDTAANGIVFSVTADVGYVDANNPDVFSVSQTYFKVLKVTVDSDEIPEPITISRIFTYYHY